VAFHCAAFGVVYDRASNTQTFVTDNPESEGVAEGNTDDTLCMVTGPNLINSIT
jgi:microtubule-associated protein-like 6